MSALRLHGVSHHYREGAPATLAEIDLAVREGEMLSIVGPSGSGKSTLLRVASGLSAPSSGRVLLDGVDVTDQPVERRGLTAMFQQPHLFTHLSVLDNVAFGPRLRGASRGEAREIARRYLSLVHLGDLAGRRTRQLSGGQQQRVALARALATERRVLLLDEPFSALDAGLRRSMHDLLLEVRAALSPTILMVTHDLDEAALADRAAVLAQGRVLQVGPVPSLYRRPASVVVARLLGGCNELPGRVEGGRHVSAWGVVDLPDDCEVRGPATLLLRREQLEVAPAGAGPVEPPHGPNGPDEGGLAGAGRAVRVTSVTSAGPRQVAVVERRVSTGAGAVSAADRLQVELPLGRSVVPGQDVTLRLAAGHPVWAVPGPDAGHLVVDAPTP